MNITHDLNAVGSADSWAWIALLLCQLFVALGESKGRLKMSLSFKDFCLTAALAMSAASANAATLNWTLGDVVFNDGGTLTGTFSTESSTGYVLSYDLTSTSGADVQGFHYGQSNSFISDVSNFRTFNLLSDDSANDLFLSFDRGLTDGGTVLLRTSIYSSEYDGIGFRVVNSGYATASPVPEVGNLATALVGLGLLGLLAPRRKA